MFVSLAREFLFLVPNHLSMAVWNSVCSAEVGVRFVLAFETVEPSMFKEVMSKWA
jgi:hypothetical protein